MDCAFVPNASEWELAYRKAMDVRPNTVRYPKDAAAPGSMVKLSEFLGEMRSVVAASAAPNSLILCAHADDNAQLFILLSDEHESKLKSDGIKRQVVLYEHLQQAVASGAINIPVSVLPNGPLGGGALPSLPFHIKGCRIGQATKFLQKFKEALGNRVTITAPTFFHMMMSSDAADDGAYEYMGHSFVVFSKAKVDKRKDLIDLFKAKNFKLIDGSDVPAALWNRWITKKFGTLGQRNVKINVTVSPKVGRFDNHNWKWGQYRHSIESYTYRLPDGSSRPSKREARLALLKQQLQASAVFQSNHPYPMYERYEHAGFDEFFDARYWSFSIDKDKDELVCVGTRHEYTCVIPAFKKRGDKYVLEKFNYFAYAGAGSVTNGLVETDVTFFATV